MANKKITAMTALGTAPDTLDVLPIVDVSDISVSASGETKSITVGNLILDGTQTLTNKTLTDCDASTQSAGNNTTKIATTAFVTTAVASSDTLAEVLANGNTTGATDMVVTAGQVITTDTISETTSAAGVTIDSVLVKDNTVTATTFTGALTGNVTGDLTGDVTGDVTGNADTVTNGVYTTGSTMTGTLSFADNVKMKLGDSSDLEIYHNISHSYIDDSGSGDLYIRGDNDLYITNLSGSEAKARFNSGGAAYLYNAGSQKLATTATGVTVTGVVVATSLTGDVTGDVTGDCSGTAATVTGATQASITTAANLVTVGTIGTGVWQGTAVDGAYVDIEGTEVKSAGETGGTKFLREDGDGTCSWVAVSGSGTVTSVAITGTDGIDVDSGSPITTSGTITLGLSGIANAALTNSSVSYGGVSVALGASDATPAFDLSDATAYVGDSSLVTTGTVTSGTWNGTAIDGAYVDIEGTEIKSTGETGGTKFLREDGDGTCSWATPSSSGTVTSITPAADTGSGTAITSSGTLTSTGGDGIDTAVSGTTTTFSLDINELTDISGTGDVSGWSAGDTMAIVDSSDSNASKRIKLPAEIGIACSDETTAITTTGDKATLMVPRGMRITEVKANVTVAETSNTVIVNVKYHATNPTSTATIFSDSTACTIATSAYKNNRVLFTDGAGGSQAYYDVAEDGFIVVSVEATAPTDAKGLKVWLLGNWS